MQTIEPKWDMPLLQFGIGAFETMRCIEGKIPLLEFHLSRLEKALEHWAIEKIGLASLWAQRHVQLQCDHELRVKWLIGLDHQFQLIDHLYQVPISHITKPLHLLIETVAHSISMDYKSCNYVQHWCAHRKACQQGYDDMLYVTPEMKILECSRYAMTWIDVENGIFAKGENLNSVSSSAFIKKRSDFWKKGELYLNSLPKSGRLYACNALHGLVPIDSVHSSSGECFYKNNQTATQHDFWNKILFNQAL